MPIQSDPPSSSPKPQDSFLHQFGHSEEADEFYSPIPDGYQRGQHKYVVVFGTVISGLGKGIFSSSLAKLLKDKALTVAPIKLEGYLNIDSGTLNPYRHGEVFVLDDGTETDMDLGTYERILDQNLSRQNFATSGQIFTAILDRERKGGYLGRDVQVIPHVTGEIKYRLRKLALTGGPNGSPTDVVFVEVGGTAGDYENGVFIEALRELAYEEGPNSTCFVALTYILEPDILGEQKSKAAQLGIKRLMEAGIQPSIIACRARNPATKTVRQKVSMFSNVPMNRVFSMHDRKSIYTIPEALRAEGLDREVLSILDLHSRVDAQHEDRARIVWMEYVDKITAPRKYEIRLGILGKYAALRDAYASIDKSIEHATTHLSVQADVQWIDTTEINASNVADLLDEAKVDGVIIPGGFGERGVEGKIACVEYVRTQRIPFLGICLGLQVAVIEYARHVLKLSGADSTEFTPDCKHPVIAELPEQKKIEGLGGTMRLGAQDVLIESGSLASFLFHEKQIIRERFRHRYEVEPKYVAQLQEAGLRFTGRHPEYPIMQVMELAAEDHPYFIGGQFHPELTSRPLKPQPLFMGLIAAAIAHAQPDVPRTQISRRWLRPDPPVIETRVTPHESSTQPTAAT
ncbi:MAG: CTP synthase [Planctomycetes bacterium]|nr:CTP synthase [Planctomycetota bacterium]